MATKKKTAAKKTARRPRGVGDAPASAQRYRAGWANGGKNAGSRMGRATESAVDREIAAARKALGANAARRATRSWKGQKADGSYANAQVSSRGTILKKSVGGGGGKAG